MNWLTRQPELEYSPIFTLAETAVWLDVAMEEWALIHKRGMAPPLRPLSKDQYHPTWSESRIEMLQRWRTLI